jgi:hypothetical protein
MRRILGKESGGPKKIGSLFDVYKKRLRAPQGTVIEVVREVIKDCVGVDLPKSAFSYSPHSKMLTLTVRGPLKTEIFLHKEEILTHVQGRIGVKDAPTLLL